MVALDDTFTESARVKTNDPKHDIFFNRASILNGMKKVENSSTEPQVRCTTEEYEPPFMKETRHANYIFNQGMETGFWEEYFRATLQRGGHIHQRLLVTPALKDTEEPDKMQARLEEITKECATRISRHKSITLSTGEDLYKTHWPGVTYFTDKTTNFAPHVNSKVKIGLFN